MAYGTEQANVRERRAKVNNMRAWANIQTEVSHTILRELLQADQDMAVTRKGRAMGVSRAVLGFAAQTLGGYSLKLDHTPPDRHGQLHGWVIDSDLASRIRSYNANRSLGWRQTVAGPDGRPQPAPDPSLAIPHKSFVHAYMLHTPQLVDLADEGSIVSLRDVFTPDMLVTPLSAYPDPEGDSTDRYHGLPLGFAVRTLVELKLDQ